MPLQSSKQQAVKVAHYQKIWSNAPKLEQMQIQTENLWDKKQEKKKIKNIIELDTNIQIKMNFTDANSSDKFLERGYDAEKDMYFYKVYFNREKRQDI